MNYKQRGQGTAGLNILAFLRPLFYTNPTKKAPSVSEFPTGEEGKFGFARWCLCTYVQLMRSQRHTCLSL